MTVPTIRRRLLAHAAAAVVAASAAACGGTDGATGDATSGATASPQDDGIVRCGSFDPDCVEVLPPDTVELRGILFRPDELTVTAGTTVTFVNLDTVAHTVTSGTPEDQGDPDFDLALPAEGDTETVTFDESGTYPYSCLIHPGAMRAVIVVE